MTTNAKRPYGVPPEALDERIVWAKAIAGGQAGSGSTSSDTDGPDSDRGGKKPPKHEPEPER